MRHKNTVFETFKRWHADGQRCVLAAVMKTAGSTYSKCGDFIVIADNGDYQGLVSGGCVEGDLAARARQALDSGQPVQVDYDLGGEHDELWGMGAGCDGSLSIVLMPLADAVLEHWREAIARYERGAPSLLMLSVEGSAPMSALATEDTALNDDAAALRATRRSGLLGDPDGKRTLAIYLSPAPRVLICGGAPDARPLIGLLDQLGWQVCVYDHRPAYVESLNDLSLETHCAPAVALAATLPLATFDAVMVMSHHLDSDRRYLNAISEFDHWYYIGLLGPSHRKRRLLDELGTAGARIRNLVSGPAGIDIGAREPAGIALSIAAEMHDALARSGRL